MASNGWQGPIWKLKEREREGGGGGTPYHLILDAITNHNFVDPTMNSVV